jgi:hypothetical protein
MQLIHNVIYFGTFHKWEGKSYEKELNCEILLHEFNKSPCFFSGEFASHISTLLSLNQFSFDAECQLQPPN